MKINVAKITKLWCFSVEFRYFALKKKTGYGSRSCCISESESGMIVLKLVFLNKKEHEELCSRIG